MNELILNPQRESCQGGVWLCGFSIRPYYLSIFLVLWIRRSRRMSLYLLTLVSRISHPVLRQYLHLLMLGLLMCICIFRCMCGYCGSRDRMLRLYKPRMFLGLVELQAHTVSRSLHTRVDFFSFVVVSFYEV